MRARTVMGEFTSRRRSRKCPSGRLEAKSASRRSCILSDCIVELTIEGAELRLRVRDDGKGIDATFLTAEGRTGHFGLHGMRERAMLMGGKLTVWTAAESGTEIELIIPAAHAYAASPRRSWFADKFSGKSVQSKS